MNSYSNFYCTRLSPEQHERTCNYWYVVTSGAYPHAAFTRREHLDAWITRFGLTLVEPLSDREYQSVRVIGTYRQKMCYHAADVAAFYALVGDEVRWLSNGQYTLGKITADADGIKTVWFLNPNITDRPVFDYNESRAMVG